VTEGEARDVLYDFGWEEVGGEHRSALSVLSGTKDDIPRAVRFCWFSWLCKAL